MTSTSPHVAERRALRHLVTHDLAVEELRRVDRRGGDEGAAGWRGLAETLRAPQRRPCTVLVTGTALVERAVLDVVAPLCDHAAAWDGRSPAAAPDLLIGALPWRYEEIGDAPGLPHPLSGPAACVLPLAFTERTVTVGPIARPATGSAGPCLACVHPAFADSTARPDIRLAPALTAFAAGATGLFVRAFAAGGSPATAMSLTFDVAIPHVEHRLWSCTPSCTRAA